MEHNYDLTLLRWTAILMFSGGILFWIGAFIPPYKQWMTADPKEYLTIIHNNKTNWYLIHSPMLLGVILTVFAFQIFSNCGGVTSNGRLHSIIGASAFSLGAVFLVLNFGFRLTVTIWMADHFTETGEIETWFKTWMDWSNLIFAIYMVLAYLSSGFLGLALREFSFLPAWINWFCIIYGFCGSIGYIVRFPLFAPPLMIHLPFILAGIFLILRIKS